MYIFERISLAQISDFITKRAKVIDTVFFVCTKISIFIRTAISMNQREATRPRKASSY